MDQGFRDDWEALTSLFYANQYLEEADARLDIAKRDKKDATQVRDECLRRISQHVQRVKRKRTRQLLIEDGTSEEGLRQLRLSLGMPEYGAKPEKEDDDKDGGGKDGNG